MKAGPSLQLAANSTAFSVETASEGMRTMPLGRVRKKARSSRAIWLGPSSPMLQPECDPAILSLLAPMPAILIWSAALMKKVAKVEQKAILPLQERPVATPTMFCSAMKHSMKLSGCFSKSVMEKVEFLVSPSSPTTCGLLSRAFKRPFPQALRVDTFSPSLQLGTTTTFGLSRITSSPTGAKVAKSIFSLLILLLSSSREASYSPPRSLPCQLRCPSIFSMKPLPLRVRQMRAVGLSVCFLAYSSPATNSRMLCPSTTSVWKPKALKRSSQTSVWWPYMVSWDCPNAFTSTNTVRLFNLQLLEKAAASQMLPSATSPSPVMQQMRFAILSKYLLEQAMPAATERPCPREPVATSTKGILGTGCPQIMESLRRRVNSCYSVITPARKKAAQRAGAAWPLERTMRSLRKWAGCLGWNLRPASWKKRTERISAMEADEVGWPLLVTRTARQASILSWLPMSSQREQSTSSLTCFLPPVARLFGRPRF